MFYVGQAKDRLEWLIAIFERVKSLGIESEFHIVNVPTEKIKYADEINYNKFMTYKEIRDRIQQSTCLIDAVQKDSEGLTIKVCEAICYDKKLITTNEHIAEYPFYDPRFIRIVKDIKDIDIDFFEENQVVEYSKKGKYYFSADAFLSRLYTAIYHNESLLKE